MSGSRISAGVIWYGTAKTSLITPLESARVGSFGFRIGEGATLESTVPNLEQAQAMAMRGVELAMRPLEVSLAL